MLSWDNLSLAAALCAVALRLLDSPRWSGLASSLALLCATIGQVVHHRRQRPALPSPRPRPTDRPAVAGIAPERS
jgi:hypothetical protein